MRSGDIRDWSRKLSESALNFGRFFVLPNFKGQAFHKLYPFYHTRLPTRPWKKFCEDTPTSLEVIGLIRWILIQILNFHDKIFRGAPSQLWFALASLSQSVSHVKIWGAAPPKGRNNYSLPKNVRLSGSVWAPITLLFVDQSSPNFCYPTWKGL